MENKKEKELLSLALRALCLTRDYVGEKTLPPIPGWDWYDACREISEYIPDDEWTKQFFARVIDYRGPKTLKLQILEIITSSNGAYWGNFYKWLYPFYSIDEIRKALTELIDEGSIRMREDSEEHDWEYVIIKK